MSVNFYKNRDQMVSAYKEVINEKSNINWALFGYEKQTNDLTLVDKGEGGLEQLFDEFNSCKILYAFCKVMDPNTELIKYIIINWQGEGAPLQRKGICINHFRDISDFFKGSHLTINARNEEDVEPTVILNKISKVSAKVNLKDRSDLSENIAPVGTNYKRVQPQREISQTDREKFWVKTQEEEKNRLTEEKKKSVETRAIIEKEREEREYREAKQREANTKLRDQQILKIRESEQIAVQNDVKDKATVNDSNDDDNERRKRSEKLRKERTQEAKSVIPERSIKNARAIFEQNSSAGQLNSIRNTSQPENKLISSRKGIFETDKSVPNNAINNVNSINTITTNNNTNNVNTISSINTKSNAFVEQSIDEKDSNTVYSTIIQSKVETEPQVMTSNEIERQTETEPSDVVFTRNLLQETYLDNHQLEDIAEEQTWDDPNNTIEEEEDQYDSTENIISGEKSLVINDGGLKRARALFDYQAADETEISFDPEDIITHIEQIDSGWWQGLASDGTYGLFPANYVELID